jgi:DNA-binding NtrC family response regulator
MTSTRRHVLLVEDEADLRELLASSLEDDGFAVTQAGDGADATRALQTSPFDGLVVDLRLPDFDGMQVLDLAVEHHPGIAAVVMTGAGGVPEAVTAIKRGAIDFLVKPLRIDHLSHTLNTAFERRFLRQGIAQSPSVPRPSSGFDALVGDSPAMRQLFASLKLVAPLNSTLLLHGATGTGKELVARAVHQNSQRASQRFVAFNAAAIPEPLAEAELFGHARGAFTGAVTNRVGRFELAHRGTLFIDEVGLMPLPLQAKLLRALQEREIERVGESRPTKFDARVIAATNTDLLKLVKAGLFREDLYYRLNVIRIALPTLAERREDIPVLARHFVERSCRSNCLPQKTLTQAALDRLLTYEWPGNVRQLENVVEHAVAMAGAERDIPAAALPQEIVQADPGSFMPPVAIPDDGINFTSVVSQIERDLILRSLERTRGNKRQAARLLQLSRTTLIDKVNRLNLAV